MKWQNERGSWPCRSGSMIAVVAAAMWLLTGCPSEPNVDFGEQGEDCDQEGQTQNGLVCENGIWVSDRDAGDGGDADDADTTDALGDTDADCVGESNEEFCQRIAPQCGEVTEYDDCGDLRTDIDCTMYGFHCEEPKECDEGDANECRCPELPEDDEESATAQICDAANADCGDLEVEDVCEGWAEQYEKVDCGKCEVEGECGSDIPNVCGCPCELEGDCYAAGEEHPDNECLVCEDGDFISNDDAECETGGVCQEGECHCGDADEAPCEGTEDCVDISTDVDHCGQCDDPCTTDIEGAEASCEGGSCKKECTDSDETLCEDYDVCTDLDEDDDHCGTCGNGCGTDQVCFFGECKDAVCDNDLTDCDGECVDTDDDPDHCGECDNACQTDNEEADAYCEDGECQCEGERIEYCDDQCVNTDVNPDHCGDCYNDCDDDEMCDGGNCDDEVDCDDDDDCNDGWCCLSADDLCVIGDACI